MNDLAEKLQKPFVPEDIEWRPQGWGKKKSGEYWVQVLAYVTNRAIMNRLDEVVSPEHCRNEFCDWHNGSQLCCLSLYVAMDDDRMDWVSKWDGAEQTHIESIKGGLSDAMKRAAVQWGIGRYLYKLESNFAQTTTDRPLPKSSWRYFSADGDKGKGCKKNELHTFYWKPPALPAWALPDEGIDHLENEIKSGVNDVICAAVESETMPVVIHKQPVDILKSLMEKCDSMDDLKGAWGAATPKIRTEIGAEFLQQQKERLEVTA